MRFADVKLVLKKCPSRCRWTTAGLLVFLQVAFASLAYAQIDLASFVVPAVSPLAPPSPTVQLAEKSAFVAASIASTDARADVMSFSPEAIAELAGKQAALAVLMRGDLRADQVRVVRPTKQQKAILDLRTKIEAFRVARQSQIVASQALEIHFGLATLAGIEPIAREQDGLLERHRDQQRRAMEQGFPINDPTALDRLQANSNDARLQGQFKAAQLRSQLALLIGSSVACRYLPEPMSVPERDAIIDHCPMIELALSQRCDLAALVYLRSHLNEETLEVARWMSDILSGSASLAAGIASRPLSLLGLVWPKERKAVTEELCARLAILDQAIASLRQKIASEVDIALYKQESAAQRFANTQRQVEHWQTRLAQLRAYGDQVKPQPADELEAEMQILHARSELVQRQGDWHQAVVELALAIGCMP